MAKTIDMKAYSEWYSLLKEKYPKTLEWVRHKAAWERIPLGGVFNEYKDAVAELMKREDDDGK